VGNRRTAAWQRLHLIDPQALAPGSRMPSYAHLFGGDGRRGEDLVAYLQSLGRETRAARRRLIESAEVPTGEGSVARGRTLFGRVCAPCHGPEGRGDGPLAGAILRGLDEPGVDDGGDGGDAGDAAGAAEAARIMDLTKGAFWAVSWSGEEGARRPEPLEVSLARTIRFGIPGTPMPGHEVLTDRQVLDLVAYVKRLVLRPAPPAAGAGRG
jgi:cytochrome c oxidase cbb3-type subunit 2